MAIKKIICFAITRFATTSEVLRSILLMTLHTFFSGQILIYLKVIIRSLLSFLVQLWCAAFVIRSCVVTSYPYPGKARKLHKSRPHPKTRNNGVLLKKIHRLTKPIRVIITVKLFKHSLRKHIPLEQDLWNVPCIREILKRFVGKTTCVTISRFVTSLWEYSKTFW